MKYPRLITEIHQIEITTRCNLRCQYCPHPKMQRNKEDMDHSTFYEAIRWCKYFYDKGTQIELSITGIGEGTLHPDFIKFIEVARKQLPAIPIVFSTNGLPSFTEEIAKACAKYSIGVYISLHRPEMAGRAIQLAKEYGVFREFNNSAATSAFDWGGKVDWFVSAPNIICDYLKTGWGVVLVDGSITTCCIDSESEGVVGTVFDPPGSLSIKPYGLCDSCHMRVP